MKAASLSDDRHLPGRHDPPARAMTAARHRTDSGHPSTSLLSADLAE
jgi:hypothetical protein